MKGKSFKLDLQTLMVIDVGPLATPSDVSVQNCRDPQRASKMLVASEGPVQTEREILEL